MKPYRLLIVDDEEDIQDFLSYSLRKEGFEVAVASNGEEGLDVMARWKPHLILLDIMMPKMDGVEMCRILRSHRGFDDVLVVFLTARDEDYSQVNALEIGGDDYITKPIRTRVLLSRIKALLRRREMGLAEAEGATLIQAGDLSISQEKRTVKRAGQDIKLPKKEFELLWLLASKPGKVFTREEIFEKVWGPDIIVGQRTIDVHIRKLRSAIGEDYVKTVKGVGYKFEF